MNGRNDMMRSLVLLIMRSFVMRVSNCVVSWKWNFVTMFKRYKVQIFMSSNMGIQVVRNMLTMLDSFTF